MRLLVLAALGAVLGALTHVGNRATVQAHTVQEAVLAIAGYASHLVTLWLLVAFVAGWYFARRPWSTLAGPIVLLGGVAGWFGQSWFLVWQRDRSVPSLDQVTGQAGIWLLAAVTVGPILGVLGGTARQGGFWGVVARMVLPGALVLEVVSRFPLRVVEYQVDPIRAWTTTILVLAGVLGILLSFLRPARPA